VRTVTRAALLSGLALAAMPSSVRAFHAAETYDAPAIDGGGGGQTFSGGPRDRGYDCAICHTDASGAIRVALASDPPELVSERRYVSGRTYRLTVALTGTHRGLGAPRDRNGFALEVVDERGAPAGALTATGADVVVPAGAQVALSNGGRIGATEWTLSWTAPPAGPVLLHVAGVDGDGGGSDATDGADPYGDDAWSGVLGADETGTPLAAGVLAEPQGLSAPGCRQAGGAGAGDGVWLVALLATALARSCRK
jgi:hypothetical protein